MKVPGIVLVALILAVSYSRGEGGDTLRPPVTNLDLLQRLLQSAANAIAAGAHVSAGDTVELRAVQGAEGWVVEHSLVTALSKLGCAPFVNRGQARTLAGQRWEIGPVTLSVRYDKMFRDGFFGTQRVRRTVVSSMTFQVLRASNGEVLSADVIERTASDTVAVDDVPALENADLKLTHGELPSDQFLDKVIETFIIIGATGVAVYLLFHVRS